MIKRRDFVIEDIREETIREKNDRFLLPFVMIVIAVD